MVKLGKDILALTFPFNAFKFVVVFNIRWVTLSLFLNDVEELINYQRMMEALHWQNAFSLVRKQLVKSALNTLDLKVVRNQ